MIIAIWAGGMPFNGLTIPSGKDLGGSESAAYYMAKGLAELGHNVAVFTSSQKKGSWDGVLYEWHGEISEQFPLGDRFHMTMSAPYDVVVIQRHPVAFGYHYNSKLNIWWLHDLALLRNLGPVQNQLLNIDQVLTVSEFHRNQVSEVYGIDKEFITATTNGVDYSTFEGLDKYEREPRSLVFAARPERGLENLVMEKGIMEMLPDCHLYVCGYENTTPQMEGFYKYLWGRCEELPNVTNMGALGKRQLYELMSKADLYVYPTTFEDTSCIAALEANAAGTPFIACKTGALPETIGNDGAILLPLKKDNQVDLKKFADKIRGVLDVKKNDLWNTLHKKALEKYQPWPAQQWETLFKKLLAEKCSNDVRLFKHMEHMSDIVSITKGKDIVECTKMNDILPGFTSRYHFLLTGNFKDHYDRYYEYEKERGVSFGPEKLDGQPRFEHTSNLVRKLNPKSVLDYGCAYGHYTLNLLARFPDIEFTGIDLNQLNIDGANKCSKDVSRDAIPPTFICGDEKNIPGTYDLILAEEVLEHVYDPGKLVEDLMCRLNPGGTMLVSVPYGPWEAMGYDDHPEWRAHIHHLERRDLFELFGNQKNYRIVVLPSTHDRGWLFLTFEPSGEPVGQIDYQRKLTEQAPRETVSVCMIVKDGEYTLGKTLQTIKKLADEIIIGIDEKTIDETERVAKKFGAHTFKITSPLDQGFDAARNETIKLATMDWILWIDDDETFENPDHLLKYLRPNCYNGYAIKHHHYAAEPAMLFKTDFPVRIFRNHKDIKFFGYVHEHPEKTMNDGVGKVMVIPDVAIMHTGYSTEIIRRRRFERNFPLMKIAMERDPERVLGKMLWARDLAHSIRYTLEVNGRVITQELGMRAAQVLKLWRGLLDGGHTRMAVEIMPFMSEAVNVLGGGIEYEFSMKTKSVNGNGSFDQPISGMFANKDDIKKLVEVLTDEAVKPYGEKYF